VPGEGFTWDAQNLKRDIETVKQGWRVVREMLNDLSFDLIVLDELTCPLKFGWLQLDDVLAGLKQRPAMQHVVIIGRSRRVRIFKTDFSGHSPQDTGHLPPGNP